MNEIVIEISRSIYTNSIHKFSVMFKYEFNLHFSKTYTYDIIIYFITNYKTTIKQLDLNI